MRYPDGIRRLAKNDREQFYTPALVLVSTWKTVERVFTSLEKIEPQITQEDVHWILIDLLDLGQVEKKRGTTGSGRPNLWRRKEHYDRRVAEAN